MPNWDKRRRQDKQQIMDKQQWHKAVVVAQLVEGSLPIQEVHGSNPVIGKILYWILILNCNEKTKIKKKRPGMAHFLKNDMENFSSRRWMNNCTSPMVNQLKK